MLMDGNRFFLTEKNVSRNLDKSFFVNFVRLGGNGLGFLFGGRLGRMYFRSKQDQFLLSQR